MPSDARGLENVNRVDGLVEFLRRWERRDELNCKKLEFAVANGGNINLQATSESSESLLFTRWHPSFAASVEAGVRELVIRLVTDWDCVTYSSCEGHRSTVSVPARVRHVRMIPRSRAEHLRLTTMLNRLVAMTNADIDDPAVLLTWKHATVLADDGLEAPGFDLIFEPQSDDEQLYWKFLDTTYQKCLLCIGQVSDDVAHLTEGRQGENA